MKRLTLALLALALTNCTTQTPAPPTTQTTWQKDVTLIQVGWPLAEVAVNYILTEQKASAATIATATKVEATITTEIAALPATQSPTSISAILADLQKLVDSLPSTDVSDAHKMELDAFISVISIAL